MASKLLWVHLVLFCLFVNLREKAIADLVAVPTRMTWHDAKRYCENFTSQLMESNLVVIADSQSQTEFLSLMQTSNIDGSWIGLRKHHEKSEFKWITGQPLEQNQNTFFRWATSEDVPETGEICVALWLKPNQGNPAGAWYQETCNNSLHTFFCNQTGKHRHVSSIQPTTTEIETTTWHIFSTQPSINENETTKKHTHHHLTTTTSGDTLVDTNTPDNTIATTEARHHHHETTTQATEHVTDHNTTQVNNHHHHHQSTTAEPENNKTTHLGPSTPVNHHHQYHHHQSTTAEPENHRTIHLGHSTMNFSCKSANLLLMELKTTLGPKDELSLSSCLLIAVILIQVLLSLLLAFVGTAVLHQRRQQKEILQLVQHVYNQSIYSSEMKSIHSKYETTPVDTAPDDGIESMITEPTNSL